MSIFKNIIKAVGGIVTGNPAAIIGGGASLIGGLIGSHGAKHAANASIAGQQAGIDELGRQYNQTRADFQPYQAAGTGAVNQLAQLYGGGPVDYSQFTNSPDYQFAQQQGEQGVLRNASATGNLSSGNTLTALSRFNQGLASQQYGNYTSRLAQLAGIGQSATGQIGSLGAQNSSNLANLYAGQGDARSSGIVGSTNAWGGAINNLGTVAGDYFSNRQPKPNMALNYTGGSARGFA